MRHYSFLLLRVLRLSSKSCPVSDRLEDCESRIVNSGRKFACQLGPPEALKPSLATALPRLVVVAGIPFPKYVAKIVPGAENRKQGVDRSDEALSNLARSSIPSNFLIAYWSPPAVKQKPSDPLATMTRAASLYHRWR